MNGLKKFLEWDITEFFKEINKTKLKTLFNTSFNWPFFIGTCIIIRVLFVDMSWLSFFAIVFSLHQFTLLFNSISYVIPVRYLLGAFMCVQFFIGPMLAYNGLDQYQYVHYKMRIPEADYFSYAIPAVLSFIFGLHLFAGNLRGEFVNENAVKQFVEKNKLLPYYFIGVGFIASVASTFFSSEIGFVFYLLGSFKFVGLFLLVIGTTQLKVLPTIFVLSSIIGSSLGEGMFHDLLTWIVFIGSVFAIRFKFGFNIKLIASVGFVLLATMIQILKGSYRNSINTSGGNFETFTSVYQQQNQRKGIFSFENLAPSNVRINQGFIITNIMRTVPDRVPFSNGEEMYQIFEAAIMPRIFAPDKLKAGDRTIFMKYSGIQIRAGTSMGLSSLGDAYLNYGIIGGSIFMFLLGLLYSYILSLFQKKSIEYPVLIMFVPLVFYYPIRPDCELQTILGHLFKSLFLIYGLIFCFKRTFKAYPKIAFS